MASAQAGDGPATARAPWESRRAGEWAARQERPWLGGGEEGVLGAQIRVGWLARVPGEWGHSKKGVISGNSALKPAWVPTFARALEPW